MSRRLQLIVKNKTSRLFEALFICSCFHPSLGFIFSIFKCTSHPGLCYCISIDMLTYSCSMFASVSWASLKCVTYADMLLFRMLDKLQIYVNRPLYSQSSMNCESHVIYPKLPVSGKGKQLHCSLKVTLPMQALCVASTCLQDSITSCC